MKKITITIIILSSLFTLILVLAARKSYFYENNSLNRYEKSIERANQTTDYYKTTYVKPYRSKFFFEPSLETLQCPILYEDRVKNYTGIQCVYSSIEMLGRWAEEPKLIIPPLTSRNDCKGYSGPNQVENILNKINVKFEQTYGNRKKGIELIKKAMKEGRGALWSVPGHAMVLVHYSEEDNRVCWVDNSDKKLKIQETTIDKFEDRWTSWALVIYGDEDIISYKIYKNYLPIYEKGKIADFPFNFVPIPK